MYKKWFLYSILAISCVPSFIGILFVIYDIMITGYSNYLNIVISVFFIFLYFLVFISSLKIENKFFVIIYVFMQVMQILNIKSSLFIFEFNSGIYFSILFVEERIKLFFEPIDIRYLFMITKSDFELTINLFPILVILLILYNPHFIRKEEENRNG